METSKVFKCGTCLVSLGDLDALKQHHKTQWHRYNLKRKLAELEPVSLEKFTRKLALLEEDKGEIKGTAHLKKNRAPKATAQSNTKHHENLQATVAEDLPYVGPERWLSEVDSLFDRKSFSTLNENVAYMERAYSFLIPHREYLKDLTGLIRYLGEKVSLGHQCLFCNRCFKSLRAVRNHMTCKGHTSIGTGSEEQQEELEPFYDFSESYKELNVPYFADADDFVKSLPQDSTGSESGDDDWLTDASEDGSSTEGHIPHSLRQYFAKHGLRPAQINDLGNLILPNGVEVAHRSLAYIYRQRLRHHQGTDGCVRLALQQAKQKRALGQLVHCKKPMSSRHDALHQTVSVARDRQRFDLNVGVKNNKLQRIVRRSDKYFI